jgi:hypothetical protein
MARKKVKNIFPVQAMKHTEDDEVYLLPFLVSEIDESD